MITSYTFKAIAAVITATVVSAIAYTTNNNSAELMTEPTNQTEPELVQRVQSRAVSSQAPLFVEEIPAPPIEIAEMEPEVVDIVVVEDHVNAVVTEKNNITVIRSNCGWGCRGRCGYVTDCYITKIEEVEIEEEESLLSEQIFVDPYIFEAKAYPNPTRDNATIELDIEISGNFTIQLFDLNGRLVEQIYDGHLDSGRQIFNTDLYDYMPGLYFISIQSLFQQETLKLQKIA